MDLAKVAIVIDPTPAEQGADRVVAASQKATTAIKGMDGAVKGSAAGYREVSAMQRDLMAALSGTDGALRRAGAAHGQVTRDAQAMTEGLRRSYALAQADARERLARGLITPAEFRKLGEDAGLQFNAGLLQTISKQGDAGAFAGRQGQAFYADLAGQLQQVGPAASEGARGIRTLSSQLAQLTASELGVRASLGSLASTLGFFSVGALANLGIMAGITGLVTLYRYLDRQALETEKRLRDLRHELKQQRDAFAEPLKTVAAAIDNVSRATEHLARTRAALAAADAGASDAALQKSGLDLAGQKIFLEKQLASARKNTAEATELLRIAEDRLTDTVQGQLDARRSIAQISLQQGTGNQSVLVQELRAQAELAKQQAASADSPERRAEALRRYYDILGFLNQRTGDRLRLLQAEHELEKTLQRTLDQSAVLRAGGSRALEQLNTEQARNQLILQEGARLWGAYAAGLGESILKHQTFEQALQNGNPTAVEFAKRVRDLAAAQEEYNKALIATQAIESGRHLGAGARLLPTQFQYGQLRPAPTEFPTARPHFKTPAQWDEELRATHEVRQAAVQYAAALGALSPATASALHAVNDLVANIKQFGSAGKEVALSIAAVVTSLASAVITGQSKEASVARGAIGGATSGAVLGSVIPGVGTIAGGAIGGVLGGIGSFLGFGKHAEEVARQMAAGRKAIQREIDEYGRIGLLAGSQFAQTARSLRAGFEDLFDELKAKYPGTKRSQKLRPEDIDDIDWATIRRAARDGDEYARELLRLQQRYNDAVAEALRLRQQELGFLAQDFSVRGLVAQGREAEADAARLLIEQERERVELLERYADELPESIRLQLEQVQALEQEALARKQALDAQRKAADAADAEGALRIRELRLNGVGDSAVSRAELEEQAAAERRRAAIMFASGEITQEFFDRLIRVIDGEFNKALGDLEASLLADVAALQKLNLQWMEDLEVRRLVALGLEEAAEDRRIQLEQEREYERMKAEGASLATLSVLDYVHTLEDQARATKKAEQAERDRLAALELAARATEDLTVRLLRARGQTEAASEAALLFQQQEELRRYREQGLGTEQLLVVQAAERAAADEERRRRQQEAYNSALASNTASVDSPDSRTTFSAAVGLTEGTGNRISGALTSGLAIWLNQYQEQQKHTRLLQRIATSLERNGGLEAIDRGVGVATEESGRAIGHVPTNV